MNIANDIDTKEVAKLIELTIDTPPNIMISKVGINNESILQIESKKLVNYFYSLIKAE